MSANPIHSCGRYGASPCATLEALLSRIGLVFELDNDLRTTGNDIRKEEGIYNVEVLPGIAVWQLLYEEGHGVDRDTQRLLQLLMDTSVPVSLSELEKVGSVGELGPWEEDGQRAINGLDAWIALLRRELSAYQGNAGGFMLETSMAFPNFVFSKKFPACLGTLKGDLVDFIPEIVSALISLADHMPECLKQPNTTECMRAFTAMSGYETSMEGDLSRRKALTFKFKGKEGDLEILCEPHMKLHRSARSGDTEYYYHRIYFSTAGRPPFEGKTLIGHIGEHL